MVIRTGWGKRQRGPNGETAGPPAGTHMWVGPPGLRKVDEDPEVNTAIYPRVKETQPEMVTVTLWKEVQASGE